MGKPSGVSIGDRFNRLEVVERARKGDRPVYYCKCICGGKATATAYQLKKGDIKSCGCLRRDPDVPHRNNSSGITGIQLSKTTPHLPYQIAIMVNKKRCHYGWFPTLEEAKKRLAEVRAGIDLDKKPENHKKARLVLTRQKMSNNTSGYTGVHPSKGKWAAIVSFRGKVKYLGLYKDKEVAAEVVRKYKEEIILAETIELHRLSDSGNF